MMTRRLNLRILGGFLLVLFAAISYFALFYRWPVARDFPWANYLLFAIGAVLIFDGTRRAFRRPDYYRGKIAGSILASLALLIVGLFVYVTGFATKQLPTSKGAPSVGTKAPDFSLPDEDGNTVTLSALLTTGTTAAPADPSQSATAGAGKQPNGVLLIFYRGYW
jgi:hypothetical protein